jgi:hypothetical protein
MSCYLWLPWAPAGFAVASVCSGASACGSSRTRARGRRDDSARTARGREPGTAKIAAAPHPEATRRRECAAATAAVPTSAGAAAASCCLTRASGWECPREHAGGGGSRACRYNDAGAAAHAAAVPSQPARVGYVDIEGADGAARAVSVQVLMRGCRACGLAFFERGGWSGGSCARPPPRWPLRETLQPSERAPRDARDTPMRKRLVQAGVLETDVWRTGCSVRRPRPAAPLHGPPSSRSPVTGHRSAVTDVTGTPRSKP